MNFFGLQDSARRDSLILLSVFIAAMLSFAWFINKLLAAGASVIDMLSPNSEADVDPTIVQLALISVFWIYILYKCYIRYRAINLGGKELAIQFGAQLSQKEQAKGQENLLHNINAEMAVASTQTLLSCYVMRNESRVNAFVLGDQRRPALVVTQGAIDILDRDEMSALIAHEYAHVANNDLNFKMRMLIALAGLNAITDIGKHSFKGIEHTAHRLNANVYIDRNMMASNLVTSFALGVIATSLGWVLSFFGALIKSGFSRKRELLADAKAVQYTRNAWGMASVLEKGSIHSKTPSLRSKHNSDLDHLCLIGPWGEGFFSNWLTNHPTPRSRILLLEPHYDVKKRSRKHRLKSTYKVSSAFDRPNFSISFNEGVSAIPIQDVENEIAIVLSVMIGTAGYKKETSQHNFSQAMRSYTNKEHCLRLNSEPGIQQEFDTALDTLMKQSPIQRNAIVQHLEEVMKHDSISTPEEKSVLAYVTNKLHPFSNAA